MEMKKTGLYGGAGSEDDGYWFTSENGARIHAEEGQSKKEAIEVFRSKNDFSAQVDDVLSGKDTTSTHLKVRENTPRIFLEIGLANHPILITSAHTKTAVGKNVKGKNIHNINIEVFKELPKLLENPAIIMESTKKGSIVSFVNAVDNANIPILCAVKINGTGYYNSIEIDSNVITSVYGKDTNPIGFIENAVKENRVLYWNKKMSQKLFEIPGLQLPDNLNNFDSNTIIRKANVFVNPKMEK